MNTRTPLVALLATLFLTSSTPLTFASEPAPAPTQRAQETELARAMNTLNSAWRKLRRQAADPGSNANSLELVATIKRASEKSATLAPDMARDLPEGERAKFIADYQARMQEFLQQLDKLIAAFEANDNAAAGELIKSLGNLQRAGHKEFRRPESK